MKVIFADTGYWVAVLNPKDDWNNRATNSHVPWESSAS